MIEEYGDEAGYFGKIVTPEMIASSGTPVLADGSYLNTKIGDIIDDK